MTGQEYFMWRSALSWAELTKVATQVVERWRTVSEFLIHNDPREGMWTVRHESVSQPFQVFSETSLRGSAPREGNPLPMLLLLGMAIQKPGSVELSFSNGQKIEPSKFEPADLLLLLPHANHPMHQKLAELVASSKQ